jgi:hypothetical protein
MIEIALMWIGLLRRKVNTNTMDLFIDEACNKISKKYNTFGIDKE